MARIPITLRFFRPSVVFSLMLFAVLINLNEANAQAPLYPLTPVPSAYDTLKIDTTGIGLDFDRDRRSDSIIYVRNHILLFFPVDAIPTGAFPNDSIVKYDWQDIDTNLTGLRAAMHLIDTTWGPAELQKVLPNFDTGTLAQRYKLLLPSYAPLLHLLGHIDTVENLGFSFHHYLYKVAHVPSDPAFDTRKTFPELVHSGDATSSLDHFPYHNNRGSAWHFFAIQAPLAWELSTGRPEIVVAAPDDIY